MSSASLSSVGTSSLTEWSSIESLSIGGSIFTFTGLNLETFRVTTCRSFLAVIIGPCLSHHLIGHGLVRSRIFVGSPLFHHDYVSWLEIRGFRLRSFVSILLHSRRCFRICFSHGSKNYIYRTLIQYLILYTRFSHQMFTINSTNLLMQTQI